MTAGSLVAFGTVFVGASVALSLLFTGLLVLGRPLLRRLGPWVERRAASAALLLPPLLAFGLVAVLAGQSAVALAAGTDHCMDHSHHLHLCLRHGGGWVSQPWAVCLVVAAATFVVVRASLSLWAQRGAHRAVARLRGLGTPLGDRCWLVPACERFAFTAGLLSPTVIVSTAAWEALEAGQRAAILAHERAHIEHGDLWRRAALGLAATLGVPILVGQALFVWELAAERICDRQAARAVSRPSTVASAMLALIRTPAPVAPAGAVFAAASHVPERIVSVLREEPDGERYARHIAVASAVGVLSCAGACGAFAASIHHTLETILG